MPTLEEITPDMALPHNIFADMGLPNPELRQAKAQVSILIERRMSELGLTQTEAAERMGLRQPEVSKIVRGINRGFSLDRMLEALTALGEEVEIVVRTAAQPMAQGTLRVVSEDHISVPRPPIAAARQALFSKAAKRRRPQLLVPHELHVNGQ